MKLLQKIHVSSMFHPGLKCGRDRWDKKLARPDFGRGFVVDRRPIHFCAARAGGVAAAAHEAPAHRHEFGPMAQRQSHTAARPAENSLLPEAQPGLVVRKLRRAGAAAVVPAR